MFIIKYFNNNIIIIIIIIMDSNKPINKVLVVVGPSGVGKDTVMLKLLEKFPNKFKKGTTHTTRTIRKGEQEGVNYYYVSKEQFLKLKDENKLVENNFYNNNYYGLSKMELEKASTLDKIMYVVIDINGAYSVHNLKIPATYVAILPPSTEVLEKRLTGRGTEKPEIIQGRLKIAKEELKRINETEFFDFKIVNNDLDKAVDDLLNDLKTVYTQLK
jgi:guanylate kinase